MMLHDMILITNYIMTKCKINFKGFAIVTS